MVEVEIPVTFTPAKILSTYLERPIPIPVPGPPPGDMKPRQVDRKAIKAKRKAAARNRRRR